MFLGFPHHPYFHGIFHEINQPIFGDTPMTMATILSPPGENPDVLDSNRLRCGGIAALHPGGSDAIADSSLGRIAGSDAEKSPKRTAATTA